MFVKVATGLLLPVGEKAGLRGFGVVEYSHALNPLTLPSPRRGEGE